MTLRPSAHGSLAKTPFAHLLLYMQARKLSGTLAVWPDDHAGKTGQDRILLEAGQLMAMRPIEPAPSLYAALLPLFARDDAPYGFYEGYNLLGQTGILREPVDLYTLLARGLRAHVRETVMDAVLERVRGRSLRLREGVPLERLELSPRELALIEPLQSASATLDALLGSGVLPAREAKRTLYLLTLLRGVEATEGMGSIPAVAMDSFPPQRSEGGQLKPGTLTGTPVPRHVMERLSAGRTLPPEGALGAPPTPLPAAPRADERRTTSSAPPAPLGLSPADEARWSELSTLHDRIDELTHYDLLKLPKSATSQEVHAAYYGLVKKFHPDRLPLSLAPLARVTQELFERLTEASEILRNPEQRAEYDKAVASGGGTRAAERTMRDVLESALEYQKAEVMVRRREYAQALLLVRSALGKNADEPDYHALYAWILHLMNPAPPAPLDEMLRSLDRALKGNPQHERAHYYKGVVLKRLKRDAEAVRHFKVAAEINPHNVEAAREVRLAVMRRESKPPPSGHGGVLSRLFKK